MKDLYKYQVWFSIGVFVCSFAGMMALLFLPIPDANREMASNAQGFLQGSLIMSAISFLLGGNPKQAKPGEPINGTTTAEFTASVTTEPVTDKENGES